MSRVRAALSLVALLLLGACATTPAPAPEEISFAPSIGVDLSAMERTASGVYLQDLQVGTGPEVRSGQRVAVYFVGWLPDGTQFSGVAPPSEPLEFHLGAREVIRGWEHGIEGMRIGGQRRLVVPPSLAYGTARVEDVPRNSVLVFIIELVSAR